MSKFIPQVTKFWVIQHFRIFLAFLLIFLGGVVVSTQTVFQNSWVIDKLAWIAIVALGFLNLLYVNDIIWLLLLAIIGFFIGWLIKILWIKSKRVQILILTIFLLNSICFTLMFFGLLYIDD